MTNFTEVPFLPNKICHQGVDYNRYELNGIEDRISFRNTCPDLGV